MAAIMSRPQYGNYKHGRRFVMVRFGLVQAPPTICPGTPLLKRFNFEPSVDESYIQYRGYPAKRALPAMFPHGR